MHQEAQTKPTRFPFLTCRQVVLEILPLAPSTTLRLQELPRPAAFTRSPEKPRSSPKFPWSAASGHCADNTL